MMREKKSGSSFSLRRLSVLLGGPGLLASGLGFFQASWWPETVTLFRLMGLILLTLALTAFLLERRAQLYGLARMRQVRAGAQSLLLTLSVIGLVILVNYLGYRHVRSWDLTRNKSFTLSEQTVKVLKNLQSPLKVTAFYSLNNPARQPVIDLLASYREQAPGKFQFQLIDPERQPGLALRYGIASDSLIFENGHVRKTLTGTQEQDLTNAVLAVTRTRKPVIYFLQGHGEFNPEDFDMRKGMSGIKQALEAENYQVSRLFLQASGGKIPPDAAVVVIAGPTSPLTASERQSLQLYLKQGGRVLVSLQARVQTGLESVLSTWGVRVGQNLVIDPGRNIQNDISAPAVTEYTAHPITRDLVRTITFFPLVRSVQLAAVPAGVQAVELFHSSAESWGETDLKPGSRVRKDQSDAAGPISLAVALTRETEGPSKKTMRQMRLVVFGNAVFASNGFARLLGNADLFLNSLAWLAEQEDLITVRARDNSPQSLTLTNQQSQWLFYLSVPGIPFVVMLIGALIWWKRR